MPTYQYACTACSERLEAVQSFTDAPLTECAACGGALRKVFSAVGVVFKGSGFYKTDSRSAAKSGESTSTGDSKSSGEAPASTSSGSGDAGGSSGAKSSSKPTSSPATPSTPASKSA